MGDWRLLPWTIASWLSLDLLTMYSAGPITASRHATSMGWTSVAWTAACTLASLERTCITWCALSLSSGKSSGFVSETGSCVQDHFLGHFQNVFPELMDMQSYELSEGQQEQEGSHTVHVKVKTHRGAHAEFSFLLAKKMIGKKKGSLMTRTLLRTE